jgi:hypothetical protein
MPVCTVNPSDTVKVTCQKPASGWPANSFTVTVSATSGPVGCTNTASDDATITVDQQPTISVKLDDSNVCSAADTKKLSVSFTSNTRDTINITVTNTGSPDVTCTADKTQGSEYQAGAAERQAHVPCGFEGSRLHVVQQTIIIQLHGACCNA